MSNDANLKLLVKLVENQRNPVYFNYPYIHSNSNLDNSELTNQLDFEACKIYIFSKHLYKRHHEKMLDYIPHFVSLLDIIYGESLINQLTQSPNIISTTSDGNSNTIKLTTDHLDLEYEYGEDSHKQNCIIFSSKMASKEIVFILNDVFMNPIDKNIERFLSSKLISDDDLISKLSSSLHRTPL